jgi:hypothetical protein
MKNRFLHLDPEFETYTYGDPTAPKQSLKGLRRGDLLVLYAGLKSWCKCNTKPGLYIIGCFVVEQSGAYTDLKREGSLKPFAKNWHILNGDAKSEAVGRKRKRWTDLILIKGGRDSRLLKKAVKISADERGIDRGGHPVFVLDPKMQKHFGTFTKLNAIQRSIPRWVKPEFCEKAAAFVLKLK